MLEWRPLLLNSLAWLIWTGLWALPSLAWSPLLCVLSGCSRYNNAHHRTQVVGGLESAAVHLLQAVSKRLDFISGFGELPYYLPWVRSSTVALYRSHSCGSSTWVWSGPYLTLTQAPWHFKPRAHHPRRILLPYRAVWPIHRANIRSLVSFKPFVAGPCSHCLSQEFQGNFVYHRLQSGAQDNEIKAANGDKCGHYRHGSGPLLCTIVETWVTIFSELSVYSCFLVNRRKTLLPRLVVRPPSNIVEF